MIVQFNAQYRTTPKTAEGRVRVFGPKGFPTRTERPPFELTRKKACEEAIFIAVLDYQASEGVKLNMVSARGDETSLVMKFEVFDETVRTSLLDVQLAATYAKQQRIDRGYAA